VQRVTLLVRDVLDEHGLRGWPKTSGSRGRSTNWTRIRINLRNVPEGERPPEDPPEPDYDPWSAAEHG
jgi:hypothetical protein